MAQKLQVNRKTFGKWLTKGQMPAWALMEMADMFDVSTDYLLGRSAS